MKKLLLLCLVLLGGFSAAFADDNYYVVGTITGNDTWVYNPISSGKADIMSVSSGNFLYKDYTPSSGTYYFHITTQDGTAWDDYNNNYRLSGPSGNYEVSGGVYSVETSTGDKNFKLTADGSTTYRIIIDKTTKKVTVTKVNQDYIVAGEFKHNNTRVSPNPIFTTDWDAENTSNSMTLQSDGTYTKTYNVTLPIGGDVVYKVVKDNNWETATASDKTYRIYKAGTYEVTIKLYIDNINGPVISVTETAAGGDFFLLGNNDGWAVSGEALVNNGDNTYSKTFTNSKGYTFIIAPSSAISSSIAWGDCIRPNEFITVSFENYALQDKKADSGDENWTINTDESVTIIYNSLTGKWQINCAPRTTTISPVGYSTYSNGEMCTISGATAYTVSANKTSSVTMNEMGAATIWPANAGMILKGKPGATVTISAVASDATATTIGKNYLVGTGNSSKEITATEYTYVFANDATHGVGFYLAEGNGTLAAHKAYLDLSEAPGKAGEFLSFNFDEEETDGISKVANASFDANAQVYNLAGQKVGANYKGIVIVNGKKVVRK